MVVDFETAGGHLEEAQSFAVEGLRGGHVTCFESDVRDTDDGGPLGGFAAEEGGGEG